MVGFSQKHPLVNFIFFAFVLLCAMFLSHPAIQLTGFVLSAMCAFVFVGGKTFAKRLLLLLPLLLFTTLLNPLLSHQGNTILFFFPSGKACTLEALLFGVFAGIRMGAVLLWFVCWNAVMTSEKLVFLFGRWLPSLSLTISMGLRFVPRLLQRFREVSDAQKSLNPHSKGIRHAGRVLSAVVSWALENALDTADSMKSRGYGLPNRSSFSVFRFSVRDAILFVLMLLLGGGVLAGWLSGALQWQFYPFLSGKFDVITVVSAAAFGLLSAVPLITEGREVLQWRLSKSKT